MSQRDLVEVVPPLEKVRATSMPLYLRVVFDRADYGVEASAGFETVEFAAGLGAVAVLS